MFKFFKSGFDKIKSALTKTRSFLSQRLRTLFGKPWSEETFEELEQILYEADLGSQCAASFTLHLRQELRKQPTNDLSEILQIFHTYALSLLATPQKPIAS